MTPEKNPSEPITQLKACVVCHQGESKYRCPVCTSSVFYCSVACSKVHKNKHPPNEREASARPVANASSATNPPQKLLALEEREELHTLFRNYPQLSALLNNIHRATLQPNQQSGGRSRGDPETWTEDKGIQRGVQALNAAREGYGNDAEGVREFSRLILLLSEP
jgi:hypothetical protein